MKAANFDYGFKRFKRLIAQLFRPRPTSSSWDYFVCANR